jgi:hypothetical protein
MDKGATVRLSDAALVLSPATPQRSYICCPLSIFPAVSDFNPSRSTPGSGKKQPETYFGNGRRPVVHRATCRGYCQTFYVVGVAAGHCMEGLPVFCLRGVAWQPIAAGQFKSLPRVSSPLAICEIKRCAYGTSPQQDWSRYLRPQAFLILPIASC